MIRYKRLRQTFAKEETVVQCHRKGDCQKNYKNINKFWVLDINNLPNLKFKSNSKILKYPTVDYF